MKGKVFICRHVGHAEVETSLRLCVECLEMKEMPVGEYDVCTTCYFMLLDKAEAEQ